MTRRRGLVGMLAVVMALGGAAIPALAGGERSAAAGAGPKHGPRAVAAGGVRLRLFYTPPVLVRAGERVEIPVDAACGTAAGTVCGARVTIRARAGSGRWTTASAPAGTSLRFDASAPASRAIAGTASSGSVAFAITERGPTGSSVSLGSPASPLRFFVVRRMPTVRVPTVGFGAVAHGRTELYVPWGTGPSRAGVGLGSGSATLGPPSFDVGPGRSVYLLDALQGRLAVFRRNRLVRSTPLGRLSPDADVAVSRDGTAYVITSGGGGVNRPITVRAIGADGRSGLPVIAGHGIIERTEARAGALYVKALPEDAWRSDPPPSSVLRVGRPLGDGSQLLSVVRGRTIRLGVLRSEGIERVDGPVELSFGVDIGELALAEPDGRGGYLVVVHVAPGAGAPIPADQYQVVHVSGDRVVGTFAVARNDFARAAPLAQFRLGADGGLYQLASFADGVRVLRYEMGGMR